MVFGQSGGYINQEIIKLSFWENEWCLNYLCLDSDAYFIRDFYYDDFMYDDHVPYTCIIEDKDLKADPIYYKSYWIEREKAIRVIQKEIGFESDRYLTCHGFQTISTTVMNHFKNNFMNKKNYTYADLVTIAPLEFSWYNMWLQKWDIIPIYVCEPHFKYFHMKHQIIYSWWRGIKIEDWARSYVGIVLQSNYGRGRYEKIGKMYTAIDEDSLLSVLKSIGYTLAKRLRALIRM